MLRAETTHQTDTQVIRAQSRPHARTVASLDRGPVDAEDAGRGGAGHRNSRVEISRRFEELGVAEERIVVRVAEVRRRRARVRRAAVDLAVLERAARPAAERLIRPWSRSHGVHQMLRHALDDVGCRGQRCCSMPERTLRQMRRARVRRRLDESLLERRRLRRRVPAGRAGRIGVMKGPAGRRTSRTGCVAAAVDRVRDRSARCDRAGREIGRRTAGRVGEDPALRRSHLALRIAAREDRVLRLLPARGRVVDADGLAAAVEGRRQRLLGGLLLVARRVVGGVSAEIRAAAAAGVPALELTGRARAAHVRIGDLTRRGERIAC